jgi:methyl-accepting chemotaxis protein
MAQIVGSVRQVADIMGAISAASEEQRDGIAQVNQAITQMDQMTQQNALLVEQAAAAADSMQGHARSVAAAIGAEHGEGQLVVLPRRIVRAAATQPEPRAQRAQQDNRRKA